MTSPYFSFISPPVLLFSPLPTRPYCHWEPFEAMCFKCCLNLSLCFMHSSWLMTQSLSFLQQQLQAGISRPSLLPTVCSLDDIFIYHSHASTHPLCPQEGIPQQKTNRDDQSYDSTIPHPARTLSKDTNITAQKQTQCTPCVNVTLCSA